MMELIDQIRASPKAKLLIGGAIALLALNNLTTTNTESSGSSNNTRSLQSENIDESHRRAGVAPYNEQPGDGITEFFGTYPEPPNVWEAIDEVNDTPLFWYVPRSGGTTLMRVLADCLDQTLVGGEGSGVVGPPSVITMGAPEDYIKSQAKYVDVDLTTVAGINRALSYDLAGSNLADVFSSQRLFDSLTLFSNTPNRARMFTMLRHPVKRAQAMFYYQQRATWEDSYDPAIASMSLEDWIISEHMVENFVVRSLTGESSNQVTFQHVYTAKEILRTKMVVGIMEWFEESMVRFEKYFGWWDEVMTNQTTNYCHYEYIKGESDHTADHPLVAVVGDPIYQTIIIRNWADMELYVYAKKLFQAQEALVQ